MDLLTREEIIDRIGKIGTGTEAEDDARILELDRRVLHPRVTDLIFHPSSVPEAREMLRGRRELTPEEVADLALAYRPAQS